MNREEREALIEKIMDELHPQGLWNIHQEGHHPSTRAKAKRILTVFEQAHPVQGRKNSAQNSDDEREWLAGVIRDADMALPPGALALAEWSRHLAGSILAAGFRRTVQGEPTELPMTRFGRQMTEATSRLVGAQQGEPNAHRFEGESDPIATNPILRGVDLALERLVRRDCFTERTMRILDELRAEVLASTTQEGENQ